MPQVCSWQKVRHAVPWITFKGLCEALERKLARGPVWGGTFLWALHPWNLARVRRHSQGQPVPTSGQHAGGNMPMRALA